MTKRLNWNAKRREIEACEKMCMRLQARAQANRIMFRDDDNAWWIVGQSLAEAVHALKSCRRAPLHPAIKDPERDHLGVPIKLEA